MQTHAEGDAVRLQDGTALYRLVSAYEYLGDAVAVTDVSGKIIFVNSTFEDLLGNLKADLEGEHFQKLVPPDGFEVTEQMVSEEAGGKWVGRTRRLHKSGRSIPVQVTVSLIRDESGYVIGRIEVVRGLDDKTREQHTLEKMEAVEQLAGGIAHNFNNLLTPILGYAQLGERALSENNHVHSYLGEIRKAAIRAAVLTRQLLSFSRRQVIEPKELNLNEFLSGMEAHLQEAVGAKVELRVKLHDDLGKVKVDLQQMEQVLMNLVSNAKDAMEDGGTLTIETSNIERGDSLSDADSTQFVMLSVMDTGVGMAEQVKAHVFEPFFTTKGLDKGIGLGLSMCYGIVTQNGGSIEVESQEGWGTTVRVYLPRNDDYIDSGAWDARRAIGH